MDISLFPMVEYWWLYGAFLGMVLVMLLLDLGVFHRNAHEVSFKEATAWSIVWVSLAMLFNYSLYQYSLWKFPQDPRLLAIPAFEAAAAAKQVGLEFLTGYLIEKALAVDNIFVFVAVFSYFGIPNRFQHRILFWGILGALFFRAIFISIGAALMQYHWVLIVFGIFLIATGIKIMFAPEKAKDPERNPVIKLMRKIFPITSSLEDGKLLVRKSGVLYATPCLLALVLVEVSDIIFAIDSVPAIFAVTKEPFIVFTSNIFAILGLRSMYFLLAGMVHKFHYIKYGLGLVLVFVGLKMAWLNDMFDGKFPIVWSLGVIFGILLTSVLVSIVLTSKDKRLT